MRTATSIPTTMSVLPALHLCVGNRTSNNHAAGNGTTEAFHVLFVCALVSYICASKIAHVFGLHGSSCLGWELQPPCMCSSSFFFWRKATCFGPRHKTPSVTCQSSRRTTHRATCLKQFALITSASTVLVSFSCDWSDASNFSRRQFARSQLRFVSCHTHAGAARTASIAIVSTRSNAIDGSSFGTHLPQFHNDVFRRLDSRTP